MVADASGAKDEAVPLDREAVALTSFSCVTVADVSGARSETVSIGAETVAVMSPGCEMVTDMTGIVVAVFSSGLVTSEVVADVIEATGDMVSVRVEMVSMFSVIDVGCSGAGLDALDTVEASCAIFTSKHCSVPVPLISEK